MEITKKAECCKNCTSRTDSGWCYMLHKFTKRKDTCGKFNNKYNRKGQLKGGCDYGAR